MNGWQVAGRAMGVVSFFFVGLMERSMIAGLSAGLAWWGIGEFVGFCVKTWATPSQQSPLGPGTIDNPQVTLTSYHDVIALKEYEKVAQAERASDEESRRQREREHAAKLESARMERAAEIRAAQLVAERANQEHYERLRLESAAAWERTIQGCWRPVAVVLLLAGFAAVAWVFAVKSGAIIPETAPTATANEAPRPHNGPADFDSQVAAEKLKWNTFELQHQLRKRLVFESNRMSRGFAADGLKYPQMELEQKKQEALAILDRLTTLDQLLAFSERMDWATLTPPRGF